jgi:hypothetical protein
MPRLTLLGDFDPVHALKASRQMIASFRSGADIMLKILMRETQRSFSAMEFQRGLGPKRCEVLNGILSRF